MDKPKLKFEPSSFGPEITDIELLAQAPKGFFKGENLTQGEIKSAEEWSKIMDKRIDEFCGEYSAALGRLQTEPAEPLTVQDIVDCCAKGDIYPTHYRCNNDTCEANEFLPEEGFKLCPMCIEPLLPRFGELEDE